MDVVIKVFEEVKHYIVPDSLLEVIFFALLTLLFLYFIYGITNINRRIDATDNLNELENIKNAELQNFYLLLSLFIIVGLLGTLLAIGDSFLQLRSIITDTGYEDNIEILRGTLQSLLGHISSAFTPTAWGIIYTLLGSLFISWTNSKLWKKYSALYKEKDISHLLHSLILTLEMQLEDFINKFEKKMDNLNNNIEEYMKSALIQQNELIGKNIANMTKVFQENLKSLEESIEKFNKTISRYESIVEGFDIKYNKFVERTEDMIHGFLKSFKEKFDTFHKSMENYLSGYANEFNRLMSQLKDNADEFKKSINNLNTASENILRSSERILKDLEDIKKLNEKLNQERAELLEIHREILEREKALIGIEEYLRKIAQNTEPLGSKLIGSFKTLLNRRRR